MFKFIIRRLLVLVPTMFIIVTLSFFLMHAAPGGPFSREKKLPEQVLRNVLARYHLDEPLGAQYLRYLGDVVLRGDLGPSFRYKDSTINELLGKTLPVSFALGLSALGLALAAGIGAGILSALKRNKWQDYASMSVAVIGISVPLFVIGPLLQLALALKLRIFPTSGWITGRAGMLALVLPAVTLSFPFFAYIARLSRGSIVEILRSDYVRAARAKGLSDGAVVLRHVLKGGLLPVLSYLGPAFAGIVTGSVVVESIFVVPGVGRIFVQSALNRDYTLIMGSIIVYSLILVVMNTVVDVAYGALDPRVVYS